MDILVSGLSVTVPLSGNSSKCLLESVSFRVEPGNLVALMGPSGAGKTTLLNRIVGRGITGEVTGTITYSGRRIEEVRSNIGYVTQEDIMYETLTPREILTFTSKLVLRSATRQERQDVVENIIQKLRLSKCADTLVGTPGLVKGISGGERKRTNVAMSLLGHPSLLLLDEPTSGLDATMAAELMTDVGSIAREGCTAIATIHQPSEAVFDKFSKVLLLDSGSIAYFGPVAGLRQRLENIGFDTQPQVPLPEMLLLVLEKSAEDAALDTHKQKLASLRSASDPFNDSTIESTVAVQPSQRLGFCGQVVVLFHRTAVTVRRSKMLTFVRAAQTILSSLGIGLIFWRLESNLAGVRTRFFVAFLFAFAQFLFSLLGVVNTFPSERAVFLRETQDKWYHPLAFYLAKVIIDTLMQSFFPFLVIAIGYNIVGLNTQSVERVVYFYLLVALLTNCGAAQGFIVSALVSSVNTALSIAPGLMMPQLLLCGVFIPTQQLTYPFKALSHIVVMRYALQLVVTNEFTCETKSACNAAAWRTKSGSDCDSSPCDFCCTDAEKRASGGICPVLTCDDAIQFLSIDKDEIWPSGDTNNETILYNFIAILVLVLVFRLLGMVALMVSYRRAVKSG